LKLKSVKHSAAARALKTAPLQLRREGEPDVGRILAAMPPVSLGVSKIEGKKMRCFRLPTNISICELRSEGTAAVKSGCIAYSADKPISACFNILLSDCPTFIDKFSPDDISTLRLDDLAAAELVLTRMTKWNQLRELILAGGDIAPAGLHALDKLKSLSQLRLKKIDFDWKTFTELNCLKRLSLLQVENCIDINELVQHLPTMPKLQTLDLRGSKQDWLNMASLRAIAKQNSVSVLLFTTKASVNQGLESNLNTEEEIFTSALKPKPNFIHPEMIDVLASMKNLRNLQIDKPAWPLAQIKRLLKAVPAARLNAWAAKYR